MSEFVESTKEAIKGGFQGIKKVRGLLLTLKKVPPRFTESDYGEPKEQIEFTLGDPAILEMFPGEEEFELKPNDAGELLFTGWVPYAVANKTPHANSSYMKVWVASAEKFGKKPSEFIGQYVTLDKPEVMLFKRTILENKKPLLDEAGEKQYEEISVNNCWAFVADETADSENTKEKVRTAIVGLNQKAALRELLVNFKNFPEFKQELNSGTLAESLGLEVVDGLFKETVSVADEDSSR